MSWKMIFPLLLCFGVAVTGVFAAPPAKIYPDRELFKQGKGHIQGVCCTEDAIYLSQMNRLWKFDWQGKLLKSVPVVEHTGDVTFWNGEIYSAVALFSGPDRGKGKIQVFDRELNLVRETLIPQGADGIVILDNVLYLGVGGEQREPHRGFQIRRFDSKSLKPLAPPQTIDTGYPMHYGLQDAATDGKVLFFSFYPGAKDAPATFRYDKELNQLNAIPVSEFSAGNGLDVIPEKISKSKDLWILRVWEFHLEAWKCVDGRFPR